jgi:signal transduction histidine kinase
MIEVAIILGFATLAGGVMLAAALRLLPSVRLQLAGLALLAVVLPLTAVLASGWVMFHMHDDVKILSVSAAAALSAVVGALLLGGWILRPLERLRATSARLADGELNARASLDGPRELTDLGRSFNEMAASIAELFDARRQLVAWASHDLRTPLASLRAMLEALEDGLAEPEEYLPAIDEQVRTLSMLVDDLFELARIDAGVLTLELRLASLRSVVESCVRALEAEARARNIKLEVRVDPAVSQVWMAPEKIERVLLNLLTNALRHTPGDGAIAVEVEPRDDHVIVAVDDTGDGLTPIAARRMFERFWRGDDSRTPATGGAGLGLAIAQGLVEAHGGTIWAENRPTGGARIAFTLPLISRGSAHGPPALRPADGA